MKEKCLRLAVLCVLVGNLSSNFYRFTPWVFVQDTKWIKRNALPDGINVMHSDSNWTNYLTNVTMHFGMYYLLICYDGESSCHWQTKAGRRDDMAIMYSKNWLYVRSTAKVIYGREKLRKKEKPAADRWYELRKVEMTLETFSLWTGMVGLVTVILTFISKCNKCRAQLDLLSAISLLISGIFQVTNLYPLISENAIYSRYTKELNTIVYFPYSLPFGCLGATITLAMAFIFFAVSVLRILKFEAKRTNACANQYQIIRLEEFRVGT